jgi:hypothetical protein
MLQIPEKPLLLAVSSAYQVPARVHTGKASTRKNSARRLSAIPDGKPGKASRPKTTSNVTPSSGPVSSNNPNNGLIPDG